MCGVEELKTMESYHQALMGHMCVVYIYIMHVYAHIYTHI